MSAVQTTRANAGETGPSLTRTIKCPYCGEYQKTMGWLLWHIKHKHEEDVYTFSPASAGEGYVKPDKYLHQKYAHMVQR